MFDAATISRIQRLNNPDLAWWQWLFNQGGEAVFQLALAREEEAARHCETWLPRLREWGTLCRRSQQNITSLTTRHLAEYGILLDEINGDFERGELELSGGQRLLLVITTPVGILAAEKVLADRSQSTVILTQREVDQFLELYPAALNSDWHRAVMWQIAEGAEVDWLIKKPVWNGESDYDQLLRYHPLPSQSKYWTLLSSTSSRSAGSRTCKVWFWDGETATYSGVLFEMSLSY